MKKNIYIQILLLVFLTFNVYCWSEEFTIERLDEFKAELTRTYQVYLKTDIAREVDLYPIALARIQMAIELYSGNLYKHIYH